MDISLARVPFADLDCIHWLDAQEPEQSSSPDEAVVGASLTQSEMTEA